MSEHKPIIPDHFTPLLGYCDHRIQTLMDKKLRNYGISPMQCRTLNYLCYQEGEVNQRMLERFLMVQPSTVNGIVNRLVEKGYVRRECGISDARCRIMRLTEKGERFHKEFGHVVDEVMAVAEQGFSGEELELLRSLLLRVSHNLSLQEEETLA